LRRCAEHALATSASVTHRHLPPSGRGSGAEVRPGLRRIRAGAPRCRRQDSTGAHPWRGNPRVSTLGSLRAGNCGARMARSSSQGASSCTVTIALLVQDGPAGRRDRLLRRHPGTGTVNGRSIIDRRCGSDDNKRRQSNQELDDREPCVVIWGARRRGGCP
jgi:hypothetical protein